MTSNDSSNTRARQALPPIRTVVGRELALGSPSSHSSARFWESREDTFRRLTHSRSANFTENHVASSRPRAATVSSQYLSPHFDPHSPLHSFSSPRSLPPSPHRSGQRHHSSPETAVASPRSPPPPPQSRSAPATSSTYILRPSSSGGFITSSPPVRRRRVSSKAKDKEKEKDKDRDPDDVASTASNARRHVCLTCGKRFNRPSSLKTHESVHTGSKPHTCTYPGCNRSFSVASNMRRHLRTHGIASAAAAAAVASSVLHEPEPDHDPEHDHDDSDDELEDVSMSSAETAPSRFE